MKLFKKSNWFIALLIYFFINEILRNLNYKSISVYILCLLITSILGMFICTIPYIYILNYFSQIEKVHIKKVIPDLITMGIYYALFWVLFKPYPGDYIKVPALICTIPTLRMLFIVLIFILPSFYISLYKENKLTLKEILCSGIFSIFFQYVIIQILVIGTIIYMNTEAIFKRWSKDTYNLAFKKSFLINYRYFLPLLALTIIFTLYITILVVKKGEKRILYNPKFKYVVYKIFLNSLFVIFAILLIQKKNALMYILYLLLLLIIDFNPSLFNYWLKEYMGDALGNTIEIFLLGFFYSFDQSNSIQEYISGDFVQSLIALLLLYTTIILIKIRTKKK